LLPVAVAVPANGNPPEELLTATAPPPPPPPIPGVGVVEVLPVVVVPKLHSDAGGGAV